MAKMKRIEIAHTREFCLILTPLTHANFAAGNSSLQLHLGLQFRQRGNYHQIFIKDGAPYNRAFRFFAQ